MVQALSLAPAIMAHHLATLQIITGGSTVEQEQTEAKLRQAFTSGQSFTTGEAKLAIGRRFALREIQEQLELLQDLGRLELLPDPPAGTGGRPTKRWVLPSVKLRPVA